ncbi:MAG: CopG family transcriptional regulator [Candidatus Dormibacteria bacterium]
MRRLQIHLDDALDDALSQAAASRGTSKAALIRQAVARDIGPRLTAAVDPWAALDGWISDGGVDDLDAIIYDES